MLKLSELKVGEKGKIVEILGEKKVKQRLLQLGLIAGQVVEILSISSLKKCYLIAVRSYALAISTKNVDMIGVKKI